MDERAEERREIEQIQREDEDDARQFQAERMFWEDGLEWREIVGTENTRGTNYQ